MADNFPQYPATSFDQAVDLTIYSSNQLGDVINGDATSVVSTESGDIPTLRKALIDNFYFKNPIQWNPGNTNTVFNQLYVYDTDNINKGWYYAPTATATNPILMGDTPVGDADWKLYSLVTTGIPAQVFPWSTEITQTTTSIVPPYEFDTAIVTYNSAVLVPGKDYTIANNTLTFTPPLTPEPDAEVPDILFCYIGKVQEGDPNTNYVTYASLAVDAAAALIGTASGQTLQDLINGGAKSVLYERSSLGLQTKNVQGMLDCSPIFCYEFIDKITNKPDTTNPETWDWTPAINAAIAASKADRFQPVILPPHKTITTGGHILTSNVMETSGGTTSDGKHYKGVPLVGYGKGITKLMFKPSTQDSICISLVGNGGGHNTSASLKGFTIDAFDSTYQLKGYGIELNCVNYAYIYDVDVYFLNENFRFHNGIANGWTEFNELVNCFSYRGNVCYSFVRTVGNDSFNGTSFTNCFGQIKKTGGGYGLKATGVSASALVWLYGAKLDIKFYGGDSSCKVISLSFAELTLNTGNLHCEGTVTMEALDDYSRMLHGGRWVNKGTTQYSVVNEIAGAQGRFVFTNAQSKSTKFANSELSSFTAYSLSTTPESYSVNGAYPALFRGQGTNFASPFMACYNYAGNGFYFGQIPVQGSLSDFSPSWKLSNDGGIIKSYNTTFRFQLGSTELFKVSTTSIYPFTNLGMQLGASGKRWSAGYFKQFSINDTGLVPTEAETYNLGAASATYSTSYVTKRMYNSTVGDFFGSGSPEGVVTGGVGSTYRRTDGAAGSVFYVKEAGSGNTGWAAK